MWNHSDKLSVCDKRNLKAQFSPVLHSLPSTKLKERNLDITSSINYYNSLSLDIFCIFDISYSLRISYSFNLNFDFSSSGLLSLRRKCSCSEFFWSVLTGTTFLVHINVLTRKIRIHFLCRAYC